MPSGDYPSYVRPYFHLYPWPVLARPGYLGREQPGSFLFFQGFAPARHHDPISGKRGPAMTRAEAQAKSGGNPDIAEAMMWVSTKSTIGIGYVIPSGEVRRLRIKTEHLVGMGSLDKLVSDMQTNGLPVDRAKAVPFHNPYSVPDDWDE